jgi:hypothetical protein
MLKRLIHEVRRRRKIIRIFPRKGSVWWLGALLRKKARRSTSWLYTKTDEFYNWPDERAGRRAVNLESEPTNRTLQPTYLAVCFP